MAYRLLARNQPVPQQVALAVQGKLINFNINLYITNFFVLLFRNKSLLKKESIISF